jgi:L-lactate utilization protein LutB
MIGQSLAPRGTYGSGTLGGFIEIKLPGQSSYKTLALTCFHCVNPSEKDLDPDLVQTLRKWRENGVKPDDDQRRELQMEHPSSMAMEDKIASLTEEIQAIETSEQYPPIP